MAVTLGQVQQGIKIAGTPGNGARGQPAFICRAVTGLEARAGITTGLDDVVGIQGEIADRAANGAAAVQGRGRAAQDLHALDDFRVNIVALGVGVGAIEKAVGNLDAINLGQHPITIDAANVVAGNARTLPGAAHRYARFATHQFASGIDQFTIQLRAPQ